MVEPGFGKELIQRRPTHMEQNHPQDFSDVEMEDATPKARDFQDLEPYETPTILKGRRRKVIEDSDAETHIFEKQVDVTEDRRIKVC